MRGPPLRPVPRPGQTTPAPTWLSGKGCRVGGVGCSRGAAQPSTGRLLVDVPVDVLGAIWWAPDGSTGTPPEPTCFRSSSSSSSSSSSLLSRLELSDAPVYEPGIRVRLGGGGPSSPSSASTRSLSFRQKTVQTLGPHVLQLWSRYVRNLERTKPSESTVCFTDGSP